MSDAAPSQEEPRHHPACPGDPVRTPERRASGTLDAPGGPGHDEEVGAACSASSAAAVTTLLAWLSPAFPVGGYAYSHGLEQAVEDGDVVDEATLETWLTDAMALGFGRNDAILLQAAHRATLSPSPLRGGVRGGGGSEEGADTEAALRPTSALHSAPPPPLTPPRKGEGNNSGAPPSLAEINDLALAFAPTRELHLETSQQGRSFLDAVLAAWPNERLVEIARDLDGQVAYPVAVGAACAAHGVPARDAAAAFLVAIAQALVSAGVRLAPIGQTSGARIVARIAPLARAIAEDTAKCTLDDLANATFRLDLGSARHETQYTRLFRS